MKIVNNSKVILLIIFFVALSARGYADSPFEITTLDNPAPGYLRFTWPQSDNFFLVDNYGNMIYETEVQLNNNNFVPLKNGNWAQLEINKYNIYDKNMVVIDSVTNPTINSESPCLLEWHAFDQLSNGHYLILLTENVIVDMSKLIEGGQTNAMIMANVIMETDRTGQIYWAWKTLDHYNILDVTSDIDLTQNIIDLTHVNSFVEDTDGNIIISVRHYDEIAKINKSTGDFVWRIGGSKCKNNEFVFTNDDQDGFFGFSHQHSIVITGENNILLYDNGNLKNPQYSRAVEYHLNLSEKKATKLWEFRHIPEINQGAMGSVQRLPNGNTLINWGQQCITEVTPENKIVYNLKYSNDTAVGSYSAYRVINRMDAIIKNINSIGNYDFNDETYNTGININVTSLSGSGNTSIERHYYSPSIAYFSDSTFNAILPNRWVFNESGINNLSATIKIKVNSISGLTNPYKATIYKRDKEGYGYFKQLSTTFNSFTNELIANFTGNGEFLVGTNFVSPPNLLKPENNSISSSSGQISWTSIKGATNYQIQFDTSSTFSNPKVNRLIGRTDSCNFDSLMYSTKYYWRVRALNSKDTSAWSSVFNFTTFLAKPNLIFPKNSSHGFHLTDTIRWANVPLSTHYIFQLSFTNTFSEIILNVDKLPKEKIVLENLFNNTLYFWRVKAYNDNNSGEWSEVWSFRTIMQTPNLIFPANDTLNLPVSFKIKWNQVSGTSKFLVQISKNPLFEKDNVVYNIIEGNSLDIEKLENDTKYYWRVMAVRSTDSSDWSETWSFNTKLKSPELIQPPNQQMNISVNCTFVWDEYNPDATYSIQVSQTSNFSNLLIDSSNISEPKFVFYGLSPYTKYFWRVKIFLEGKESEWSQVWYFLTDKGIKLTVPKLLSPKDKSEGYIKGTLTWLSIENAIKYRIQISKFAQFSELLKDTIVDNITEYNYIKFNTETIYYWRVKALSEKDSSDWSTVWSFKVIVKSEIVKLLSPANDDLQIPIEGNLEWEPISGAYLYQVQISNSPDFINLIGDFKYIQETKYHYSNLKMNETFYWRVRFLREYDTSGWSNVWTFNTLTSHVLNLPKLLTPEDGAEPVPISGEMTWTKTDEASKYLLSLSTSLTFETFVLKESDIKTNIFDYSDLNYNTKFYWRVAALNDSSKSNWSDVQYFTTELEAPVIKYPQDNSIKIPLEGDISWFVSIDDSYYLLQIATDHEFNDLVFESGNLSELKFTYSLVGNTTYFCRVKAVNETNYSRWSPTVQFTTLDPNSVNQNLLDTKIILFPNPTFDKINLANLPEGLISYKIFDEFGQVIISGMLSREIDVHSLTSGVYFLKIGSNPPLKFIKI